MRKAVILARVSTKRQEEEGLSLEEIQLPEMREYAAKNDFEVVKEFVFSESADRGIRKRFNEVIDFIRRNKEIEVLITYRVDRATRNFADAVAMDTLRLEYEKELHFVHDRLVITKQSRGREITDWDTKVYLAKQTLNRLKEDAFNSKYAKLRDGELPWGAPFGYKNHRLDKRHTTVERVPFDANVVLKMFELYATGTHSYYSLRQRIKDDYGVNKAIGTIGEILSNRFYIGEIYDKETSQYHPHLYDKIVPDELFWDVQDVLSGKGKKRGKQAKTPHTYQGIIHCKICGCAITPEPKKKVQKNGNVHHYVYYHCTGKKGKHSDTAWLEEREVTEILGKLFDDIKIPDNELPGLEQTLLEAHSGKVKFHKEQVNYHTTEAAKYQTMIENAYEDKCMGSITQAEYDQYRAKWRAQQKFHEKKLARLTQADEEYYLTVAYLLDIAARGKEIFAVANQAEKRELIGLLGQNLVLSGKNIEINLYKPFDTMASCHSRSVWQG